ncbi:Disease resistance protein TIR-NBS-LRR class family [Prunus dulcis]|uniref:Disease resistance protein TIR-NBS-LRR class family n=1 Tax=Prunus dulcis TaxID=3755 RepID=A0A4Y1RNI6_PRUDU|nr:Disease resistance protein TIR-NBS-LRR class family [Prunus dulcis]
MKLYSDHVYAAGGTLSGSSSVGLLCYKHYPMYLPRFRTWIRTLEILGNVGTRGILDGMGGSYHTMPSTIPLDDTSRRKPSADANLQAQVERLRYSFTKLLEKYEHLHCRNVELEHDYHVLKQNWERTHTQDAQQDLTQNVGHTQPNQPVHFSHSASAQSRLRKGKVHLHPKLTQSQLFCIPPLKNRPHEPVRIYKDYRDRISDR